MRPVQVHRRRGAVRPLAFGAALVVAVSVGVVGGVGTVAHAAPAPVITRTDLPRPAGAAGVGRPQINERGDVAALTVTRNENHFDSVTVWADGKVSTFDPNGRLSQLQGFNDRGQVLIRPEENYDHHVLLNQGELLKLTWPEDRNDGRWGLMSWLTDQGHVILGASRYDTGFSAYHWAAGRLTRIDPPGSANVRIHGVNRRGQALISYYLFPETGPTRYVGLWQDGAVQEITVVPPAGSLDKALLNERGQAVVITKKRVDNQSVVAEAFRWAAGRRAPLPAGTSHIDWFTDGGQVLGADSERRFLWNGGEGPGSVTTMEERPGMRINDVNDRGQVVGVWQPADGSGRQLGFLWQKGEYTDLSAFGHPITEVEDINNAGLIVGTGSPSRDAAGQAILWHGGTPLSLGDAAFAFSVTESGYVLGWSEGHPVRWRVEVPAGG